MLLYYLNIFQTISCNITKQAISYLSQELLRRRTYRREFDVLAPPNDTKDTGYMQCEQGQPEISCKYFRHGLVNTELFLSKKRKKVQIASSVCKHVAFGNISPNAMVMQF